MTWRDDSELQHFCKETESFSLDEFGEMAVAARDRELRQAIEADRATWPLGYMDAHYFYERVLALLSGTERTGA